MNRNRAGQGAGSATDNGEANASPISPQSAQVQIIPVDDVAQITRSYKHDDWAAEALILCEDVAFALRRAENANTLLKSAPPENVPAAMTQPGLRLGKSIIPPR